MPLAYLPRRFSLGKKAKQTVRATLGHFCVKTADLVGEAGNISKLLNGLQEGTDLAPDTTQALLVDRSAPDTQRGTLMCERAKAPTATREYFESGRAARNTSDSQPK